MTPQGISIVNTVCKFVTDDDSNNKDKSRNSIHHTNKNTLPYYPCKKGYQPIRIFKDESHNVEERRMYGCWLHHEQRKKRILRNDKGMVYRPGETELLPLWLQAEQRIRENEQQEKK